MFNLQCTFMLKYPIFACWQTLYKYGPSKILLHLCTNILYLLTQVGGLYLLFKGNAKLWTLEDKVRGSF